AGAVAQPGPAPLTEPAVRQRLTAILAADVAGFSRLMAGDERATVAALDAARSVFRTRIEAHHGRVIDMAGDSVLGAVETAPGARDQPVRRPPAADGASDDGAGRRARRARPGRAAGRLGRDGQDAPGAAAGRARRAGRRVGAVGALPRRARRAALLAVAAADP